MDTKTVLAALGLLFLLSFFFANPFTARHDMEKSWQAYFAGQSKLEAERRYHCWQEGDRHCTHYSH